MMSTSNILEYHAASDDDEQHNVPLTYALTKKNTQNISKKTNVIFVILIFYILIGIYQSLMLYFIL